MFKINTLASKAFKVSAVFLLAGINQINAQISYGGGSLPSTSLVVEQADYSGAVGTITQTSGTNITGSCWKSSATTTASFTAGVPGVTVTSGTWVAKGGATITAQSGANVTAKPVYSSLDNLPARLYYNWKGTKDSIVNITSIVPYDSCWCGPGSSTQCKATTKSVTQSKTFVLQKSGSVFINLEQEFSHQYKIVGPTCIAPGDSVTFSIKSLVSTYDAKDGYFWTYSAGGVSITNPYTISISNYQSLDFSSITNKVANITFPANLKVKVGTCNQSTDSTTLIFKQKIAKPVSTLTVKGVATNKKTSCLDDTTSRITVGITSPNTTDIDYLWSTDESTFIPQGSLSATSLIFNVSGGQTGRIFLSAKVKPSSSLCTINDQPLYDTIYITRSLKGAVIVSSPTPGVTCLGAGDSQTFTLSPDPNVNVTWTFGTPTGWSITGTKGSVSVTAGSNVSPTTLTATGVTCPTGSAVYSIDTKAGNLTGRITGDTLCLVASNTTARTLTVPTAATLAISYQWTLPTGWTANSPATTVSTGVYSTTGLSITVNPDGVHSGTVSVIPLGNCANGTGISKQFGFSAIAATDITFGGSENCINSGLADAFTLQVANPQAGQTYNWSITVPNPSPNFSVSSTSNSVSGITSDIANISTTGVNGSYTVKVAASSDACPGTTADYTKVFTIASNGVYIDSTYNAGDDVNEYWAKNSATSTYFPVNAGTSYIWNVNGSAVQGPGTNGIARKFVLASTPSGSPKLVTVDVQLNGSTCTTRSASRNTYYSGHRLAQLAESFAISVSPNPAQDEVGLKITNFSGNKADVTIADQSGNIVEHFTTTQAKTTINTSGYVSGIYIVTVVDGSNKQTTKLSVVK